jgi:catechol 2,3-dioxygenase-like lactoylglutathione lyase family enzyme
MHPDDFPVFPSPFFAGLVTARLFASWDFYTERLGFRTLSEGGGGVRLQHPCGAQLLLLQEETGHTPAELVSATNGRGWWLTLEVADVAAMRLELTAADVAVQSLPAAGYWPAGTFAVSDPDGVLVVIAPRTTVSRQLLPASATAVA